MTTSAQKAKRITAVEPVTALQHLDLLEKMIRQFYRDGEYQPHDVFRTLGDVRSAIEQRERVAQRNCESGEAVMAEIQGVVVQIRDLAIRAENKHILALTAKLLGY